VITVCKFLQEYMKKNAGKDSIVLPFPGYGPGPFPDYSNFDNGFVLLVNASQIKGLPIFLELARSFPQTEFGAISTWATTETDRCAIKEVRNVVLIEANSNIDNILRHTRVLLVPSLWQEAFPITVIEAELRGIPTLVSQVGGLPETKFGTDYVLPVNPIQEWKYGFDSEEIVIEPIVPKQETGPWIQSLKTLLENRMKYESISRECRKATHDFLKRINIKAFEEYFESVVKNAEKLAGSTPRRFV
jgi:glycosyltransferase involved in cell wall biosynthesis